MSLFGTSPEEPSAVSSTSKSKPSLFADEPAGGSSSLFADDTGEDSSSHWNPQTNTAKRTARRDLVRTLLPATDVPESYVDSYDLILNSGDRVGSGVGLTSIREILSSSDLTASDQGKIFNLVVSGDHESSGGLGRSEFNVLLALIGLAQEGEDLSFDAVDDHRKKLPQPHSSFLDRLRSTTHDPSTNTMNDRPSTPPQPSPLQEPNSARSQPLRRGSLGGLESDPWGSPELHRNHAHVTETTEQRTINGYGSMRSTTNAWSSRPVEEAGKLGLSQEPTSMPHEPVEPSSSGSGWDGAGNFSGRPGVDSSIAGASRSTLGGFGPPGDDPGEIASRRRSLGIARPTNPNVEESVVITLLPEKEGMFMFQHRNYEVKSARRGSTVVRRYSDFVWLLDCLQKRFPFRQLPLLPPKRVSDSLPPTLDETFDTARSGVKRSAEIYINLCTLLERLAKRNDGLAADHLRFSLALQSLTEVTKDTYSVDTYDIPSLNTGITATARHLSVSQSLLEDEARAWSAGVLEDLKRQRDCLVSVREMFDRRDRYARNNIPQLERRIETNERKLQDLRGRPAGTVKPGEIEKVEDAIFKDKESIVQQHARGIFIKECIRDELVHFQQSQYHISRLHQDWSQERVKYSELQAENWRRLSDAVEGMPTGE
ncbi:hypothetical protein N7450_010543 [Penicillium hetheringtonii]|uniref:Sorting nexin MVP1 n=1 Tax=Penicillium hetheringtonii TaxID=911720 RepID=A0AAD6GM33_9EURO|nr:hypothetical protein N7450_010543 [Penicillium hetheringtonii]